MNYRTLHVKQPDIASGVRLETKPLQGRVSERFEFKFESLKSISVLILFVFTLMIGSSKNNRENYPRKCFWTEEKETPVKFNPGLSANRPLSNWAWILTCHSLNWVLNLLDLMIVRIKMMLMRKLLKMNQWKMRLTMKRFLKTSLMKRLLNRLCHP